jgi:hypothetical protein
VEDIYLIEEIGRIEAEEVIQDSENLRDIVFLELIDDSKNIVLLKKQMLLLFKKVGELEAEIKYLKRKIQ